MAQIKYIDQNGLQQAIAALKGKTDAAYLAKEGVAKAAEKLNAAVKINGVDFDGSADITVQAEPEDHQHEIADVNGLQNALDAKLEEVKAEDLEFSNTNMSGVANVKQALETLAGVNVQMVADVQALEDAIGEAGNGADVAATGLHKVIADADAVVLEAAKQDAAAQIAALVNSAPEAMNTLKELADAIEAHQDVYDDYVDVVAGDIADAQAAAEAKAAELDAAQLLVIQAEIDADVKAEADRAKEVEEDFEQRIKALEDEEADEFVALSQAEIEAAIGNAWV